TRKLPLENIAFRSTQMRLPPRDGPGFTLKDLEKRLHEDKRAFGQCLAALGLSWRGRADAGSAIDVPCVDFGPAQLVLLPAEAYVEHQLFAQKLRPDAFVVVMGYGECGPGYIPTEQAVQENDGNLADWNWVAVGAEKRMQQALAQVLQANDKQISATEILDGLKSFYAKTARADGSFQPGIDPTYKGMSDCAASDLAAPTYAVVLHRTFGWKLPHEEKTIEFFQSRQQPDGAFVNVAGTNDPKSSGARLYNTTQALVALHGLGAKPRVDPLPVFDVIMEKDYATLPPYTTSFFPLAYATQGKKFPKDFDRKMRALMVQTEDGYMKNHIAATFHVAHYYALMGEPTPLAEPILRRMLKDQKEDGSWLINPPARDRHASFDGVFTLVHLGKDRKDCKDAVARAANWALSCRTIPVALRTPTPCISTSAHWCWRAC
ncbi:MAG: hypothetical protein L0215_14760, partial [Gemmataceae bacterium]|nr:hypothetical protein [Gemmataceae bacterium]